MIPILPGASIVADDGTILAGRVFWAGAWHEQLRGLIGLRGFGTGDALVLPGCGQVHTAFLKQAITVIFLSRDTGLGVGWWRVVAVQTLAPWRVGARVRGAGLIAVEMVTADVCVGQAVFIGDGKK